VFRDEHVRCFVEKRGIPDSILMEADISSGEEYFSQTGRKESCICFNYYEGNRLVNTKFRTLDKHFKMTPGAELIPYNINGILGKCECIITEGEIDALSFMAIGRTDVISVPGGANRNLTWMDRFIETHFEDKRVIYLAVDNDRKGNELRDELLRRLGPERCRIIDLSPSKDANELLLEENGAEALLTALMNAPEAPLEGVYTANDVEEDLQALFDNGPGRGAETGLTNLDKLCTFELGRVCVVTGIPGSGKSEFVDELVIRLNMLHGWKAAYFSPENQPLAYHFRKLVEKLTGQSFKKGILSQIQLQAAMNYLSENIFSILPRENYTIDHILSRALELVRRKGINTLVLDPINRVDHQIPAGQSETNYISSLLDSLSNFAMRNKCLVILVAHPRKMNREPGRLKEPVPSLYDINGSANYYNKADFGLVVERDRQNQLTNIHVQKVKFKHLGDNGEAPLVYNIRNGRFGSCELQPPGADPNRILLASAEYDNDSWLPQPGGMQLSFEIETE
ncbi:MAG: toprim domain-containing protein, partial [Bacteroides sp.]|nr:toprim domain-containing protein [Bacteroides sp.]